MENYGWLTENEKEQMQKETAAAWQRKECDHRFSPELYYKEASNGVRRYYNMCVYCYQQKSIKKATLNSDEMFTASLINQEWLNERYRETQKTKQLKVDQVRKKYQQIADQHKQSSQSDYNQYLTTPEWYKKRALVMKRCNNICEGCGINKARQVHHLTYKRIYNEMLFDLVGVCWDCHKKLHK